MSRAIPGLHHVTAISGPPQANVDFYVGTMRQRLVKRTVNFDAPDTYHLYYGDRTGSPGTILTFFPFADAGPGRAGPGMASAVAYRVPPGGLDAWMMRLAEDAIDFEGPAERFGERMIALTDPDGLRIELIEAAGPSGAATARTRAADDGFHSVTLWLSDPAPTARVLTDLFGYEEAGREASDGTERLRFRSPAGGRGSGRGPDPLGRPVHRQAGRGHDPPRRVPRREPRRSSANGASASPPSASTSRP